MSLLALEGVTKNFDTVTAVSEVSLTVEEGETLAVIGPNGAGKSTLFGLVAGEYPPTGGRIILGGRDVTSLPASRLAVAGVSRTFQVARLFSRETLYDNLLVAAVAARRGTLRWWDRFGTRPDDIEKVDRIVERLQLGNLAAAPAHTLPQGERKRLELAMAIVQEPRLLLLDEPTAGMGLEDIQATIDVIREVKIEQPEMTIIISAHDMEVVFELGTRVVLLARGEVALVGTPSEVEHHPITREIYLGAEQH